MNFKDFLLTFDSYLQYENLFSSHYYGYVNNVFVEKKLLYPILIYHTDAMNHSILDNSITVLKFNFFVFDKLKTDNSNIIDVQDDLLKKLVKIQSYLKRKFFATNFNINAISDEAYSEKITGWVMECLIKLDSSFESCVEPQFLVDGISKYDRETYTLVECLLEDGTEIAFPDYSYFNNNNKNPVMNIKNNIFQNIRFTGDFKMNNLENINFIDFHKSMFDGTFEGIKIKKIGDGAFYNSKFIGELNLPECEYIGSEAFLYGIFNSSLTLQKCKYVGNRAFYNSRFIGSLNLPECTYIGLDSFRMCNFSGELNLPECAYIGPSAFLNSNFLQIKIGQNVSLFSNCIGAHSAEFIADYAANGKLAGTYVWDSVTGHWIYQN